MANSYKSLFGSSLAAKNPNLGKVINQLNIGLEGTRVALNLKLDEATVQELSKQAEAPPVPPETITNEPQAIPPPPPPSQDS
jgi:hypothetical protein